METTKCYWEKETYFKGYYRTSCKMNYEINSQVTKNMIIKGVCPYCKKKIVIR